MKNMYILRGISGSGKTTFAESFIGLAPNTKSICVASADDYFYDAKGNYAFKADELKLALQFCRECVEAACKNEVPYIFVCNTNTQKWEFQPYENLAEQHGYKVFHIVLENRHQNSNVHGVPTEVLKAQKERFEISL